VKSLTSRVLLGTTAAVAAVLLLSGYALYALVERSLVGEVDRDLVAKARLLASTVAQEGWDLHPEFQELDMGEFAAAERGGFFQLWLATGETLEESLYRSPSLGEADLEVPAAETSPTAKWIDLPPLGPQARGRAVALRFQPQQELEDSGVAPADLVLALARDARALDQALATLKGLLALVGLVALAVAGAVLVAVVRRSLRPLGAVSQRIATIKEDDLETRLETAAVPNELLPVIERINGLLARLEAAFARERGFSNDVAHELRTPLAGLRTILDVAAARPRSEQECAAALRESAAIVEQLQAMVERLLQLARLDGGRSPVVSERYDLADVALEVWESFAAHAVARGLSVELRLGEGIEMSSDRELVGLILRNLYENAVTYADSGGQVRISAHRVDGSGTSLEVSNSGSRLGQGEADAATQRFWRGDAARTDAALHCGLGLTLVEKATRALAGRLELRSEVGGEFVARVTLQS